MANESDSPKPGKQLSGLARAAMWMGGSALFGSLALVLWNRRALRSLHEAPEGVEAAPLSSDDDIY
jgi:hypothetical protein